MARAPDFFSQMTREELEKLEAFAREPGKKIDQVHDWILAQGWKASRSAVGRWLKKFREIDRQSAAAELADAIYSANAGAGMVDVAGAVSLQVAQRLQTALLNAGDKVAIGDLHKAAMAVVSISNAQAKLNELKKQQADALKAAESAAASGKSATDVVETIKAALGIAA